jgi:hypothetical protein
MFRNFLALLSISVLLLNFGCGGPSVTSSDSTGIDRKLLNFARRQGGHSNVEGSLAAGTVIRACLENSLSTENNVAGDPIIMKVVDGLKIDDKTAIPIGSTIKGVVAESVRSGRVKGRAQMSLRFTELILPNGKSYAIQTASVSHIAPTTKKRDGMMIGGGAGLGALIGGIAGDGKGAGIGAASGAGAGTGVVLATRGKETGFSAGSTLNVKLTEPLKINLS